MPEYRQDRAGAIWVFERSWGGIREDLEEHQKYGEDASAFIVRTSSAEADEARADEHSETKAVFLARGSADVAVADDALSGGRQPADSAPSAGEASPPDRDGMQFADSAEASEEVDPPPDHVPGRAAEPRPKEAPRNRASVSPKRGDFGGKNPMRLVVVAAVLVVAAIAGTLFMLSRTIERRPPDEIITPEGGEAAEGQVENPEGGEAENPEDVPDEPVADRESDRERLLQRRRAEEAGARREREMESRMQALQTRLEALEREPTAQSPPPDDLVTEDDDPTPDAGASERPSAEQQNEPPPPVATTPEPAATEANPTTTDAATQALLQQMQALQQELSLLREHNAQLTESSSEEPAVLDLETADKGKDGLPEGNQIARQDVSHELPPEPTRPIAVAGAVTKPVRVKYGEPRYPAPARRMRAQGTVVLRLTINTNGDVTDVEVLAGQRAGLTEAAMAAVRQWKYRPATLNGRPVAVYYKVTVTFRL